VFSASDRDWLRDLARRVAEIAELPIQAERRELWTQHNSLKPVRPMLLVFPEGSWVELLPPRDLRCEGDLARAIEGYLRDRLYYHEHFCDDTVIEREWIVPKAIRSSGWGLEERRRHSETERGAWGFDPVILEPADLGKLRFPEITHDEAATRRRLELAEDLFGDILEIKLQGVTHISYHLMKEYTGLRGLEQVMIDMIESPAMLHDAMGFLSRGHQHVLEQHLEQNLLSLNNDSTYNSTGGNGYTNELPAPGFDPARVRPADMWASAEAQEMAQVSPRMHEEFILRYEKQLLEPFGLNGYGCCEDLSKKLDRVLQIPRIRRISISPFADVDRSAQKLAGRRAIFSWKPQPAHLVGRFDEQRIRKYLRHTLEVAGAHDCVLEIILKDTHTCEHHPERFDRWLRIAREEIERSVG
jgi:hypothetical protein